MTELLISPTKEGCIGTLILAHGAGAPMDSEFMEQLSVALNAASVDVVRFEFPYMQQRRATGSKRPPDRQPLLLECWRQVYEEVLAMKELHGPVYIGGKSMGGRMATLFAEQYDTQGAIAGVCCFGYPFFPPGKNKGNSERVQHLLTTITPTLIVQGIRDPFGKPDRIEPIQFSDAVELCWLEAGDHDFKPTVRSGIDHQQHIRSAAQAVNQFMTKARSD